MTDYALPPTLSAVALAQLLVTRLCHDVANPIGAINNGMELLAEDASMREAAMELIASSATQAGARIQFYRYMFGMLKGEGIVDMRDKQALIAQYYTGSKVEVEWRGCPATMIQPECQILCNLLCLAGATLIRGGHLTIEVQAEGETLHAMHISARGSHVKFDEDMHDALLGRCLAAPTPKTVHPYYTALLAAEQGGSISVQHEEGAYYFHYRPAQK
jgi:histidine phosphotransferase ChpT